MNHDTSPVDTLRQPHEPHVDTRSTAVMWTVVLAGPVLVMTHFWLVYLVAESACAADRSAIMSFMGPATLEPFVTIATLVGSALALTAAVVARRRRDMSLSFTGVVLSIGSAATIAAVGFPILALSPC